MRVRSIKKIGFKYCWRFALKIQTSKSIQRVTQQWRLTYLGSKTLIEGVRSPRRHSVWKVSSAAAPLLAPIQLAPPQTFVHYPVPGRFSIAGLSQECFPSAASLQVWEGESECFGSHPELGLSSVNQAFGQESGKHREHILFEQWLLFYLKQKQWKW